MAAISTSRSTPSASESTFEQALNSLTVGGRLVGVGMSADAPTIGPTSIFNLLQAPGARPPRLPERRHRHAGRRWCRCGRLDLSRSISAVVPLEDVAMGIEKLDKADGDPIRILVQP